MTIRLHKDKHSTEGSTWLESGDYKVVRALGNRRFIIRVNSETRANRVLTIVELEKDHGEIIYAD